jgi:hypothetical protein
MYFSVPFTNQLTDFWGHSVYLFQAVRIPQEDTNYISDGEGDDEEEEEEDGEEEEEEEVCDTMELKLNIVLFMIGKSFFNI